MWYSELMRHYVYGTIYLETTNNKGYTMLIEDILAAQNPENITKTSNLVAKKVFQLTKTDADTAHSINITNNTLTKKDGVILLIAGGKTLLEAVKDDNGEYQFKFNIFGATAVSRIQALQQFFSWDFVIASGDQSLFMAVNNEVKLLKRGFYTVEQLELMAKDEGVINKQ